MIRRATTIVLALGIALGIALPASAHPIWAYCAEFGFDASDADLERCADLLGWVNVVNHDDDTRLIYRCDDLGDGSAILTWHYLGVPSDSERGGSDHYYVRVVIDDEPDAGRVLYELAGAEDNAWGTDYAVGVPTDVGIYMQVINAADGFWFEFDRVIMCLSDAARDAMATETETETTTETLSELPYTGLGDWLLPVAVAFVALGAFLTRLGSHWRK